MIQLQQSIKKRIVDKNFSSRTPNVNSPIYRSMLLLLFNASLPLDQTSKRRDVQRPECRESRYQNQNVSRRILESYCVFIFDDRPCYTRTFLCVRLYVSIRAFMCVCICTYTRILVVAARWSRTVPRRPRAPQSYRHSRLDKNPWPGPVTQNWKHFTRRRGRRHVSRIRSNKLRGIGNRRPRTKPHTRPAPLPPPVPLRHRDFLPMSTCAPTGPQAPAVISRQSASQTPPFYGNKSYVPPHVLVCGNADGGGTTFEMKRSIDG